MRLHPLFILSLLILCSCVSSPTELTYSEGKMGTGGVEDLKSFETTVHPILKQNCAGCHSATVSPFFAHSNSGEAMKNLSISGKVSLARPEDSRIYKRLKFDSHNCWSGCEENAAQMLEAIKLWARLASHSGPKILTKKLTFSETQKEPASVENEIIVEAEKLATSGRFTVKQVVGASGMQAVASPMIQFHPFKPSTRYGVMNSGCSLNPVSETYQPYKVLNSIRNYPNANGYPTYYLTINFVAIRPDRRSEYLELLKTKSNLMFEDYRDLQWTRLGFNQNNTSLPMLGVTSRGGVLGIIRGPVILPDGYSVNKYHQKRIAGELPANYFDKRFNGETYNLTSEQLRQVLGTLEAEEGFIKKVVWPSLAAFYKNVFFNGNTPRGVPVYNGDTFSGGLKGETGFNYFFPLKYENAGDVIYQNGNNIIREIDKYFYMTINPIAIYDNRCNSNTQQYEVNPSVTTDPSLTILNSASYNCFNFFTTDRSASSPTVQTQLGNESYSLDNVLYSTVDLDVQLETLTQDQFAQKIHPILNSPANSCFQCHNEQVIGAPQFASSNARTSYQAARTAGIFNFSEPAQSPIYAKLLSYHSGTSNCGTNEECENLAQEMLTQITQIKQLRQNLMGQSSGTFYSKSLTPAEKTPGQLIFDFKVINSGKFKPVFRHRYSGTLSGGSLYFDSPYQFNYSLYDEAGNLIPISKNVNGIPTPEANSCRSATIPFAALSGTFKWFDEGGSYYYQLPAGKYQMRIFEGREGIEIDSVGLSSYLEKSFGDIFQIQSPSVETFNFDISQITGVSGAKFKIDVATFHEYYNFSNPRIEASRDIWIKGIGLIVNDNLSASDSTFRAVAKRVGAGSEEKLIQGSALLFKDKGSSLDKISISFDELRVARSSDITPPPAGHTGSLRVCKDVNFFQKNIKPIFTRLSIYVNRDGREVSRGRSFLQYYLAYFNNEKLGTKFRVPMEWVGGYKDNESCMECHSGNNSSFNFNLNDDQAMCNEVMARVNFEDPDDSKIFKGIDELFGHKVVTFAEVPVVENGQWPDDADSYNGKKSTWAAGDVYEIYENYASLFNPAHSATCNPSHITDPKDLEYLKKFVGTFKREQMVLNDADVGADSFSVNTPRTFYDQEQLDAGQPLPPNSFYLAGQPGASLQPEKKRNIRRLLYPADYICGPWGATALIYRVHPAKFNVSYRETIPNGVLSYSILTPDKKSPLWGTVNSSYSGTRTGHANSTLIVPVLKPGGELNKIPETGRIKTRELIKSWILHEKSLR